MNSHYAKGRRAEYKLMKKWKDDGALLVARSAGSHGKIDVFGVWPGHICMAQVKSGCSISKSEMRELDKLRKGIGSTVAVKVLCVDDDMLKGDAIR